MSFLKQIRALGGDRRGISAVEYAILIGVVGVGLAATLSSVPGQIGTFISSQITSLSTATSGGGNGGGGNGGGGGGTK